MAVKYHWVHPMDVIMGLGGGNLEKCLWAFGTSRLADRSYQEFLKSALAISPQAAALHNSTAEMMGFDPTPNTTTQLRGFAEMTV